MAPPSGEANSRMFYLPPDKYQAVRCYLNAIEIGQDVEAYNCLGLIYESGFGIDIDLNDHGRTYGGRSGQRDRASSRDKMSYMSKRSGGNVDLKDSSESSSMPWEDESNPNRGVLKAQRMYELALAKDPNCTDCLFNLGFLKYRQSQTVNLLPQSDHHGDSSQLQRQDGIGLLRKASDLGHLRAQQFLAANGLLFTMD